MLEVSEIHTYYGLAHVLAGVSLTVNQGEVVCLLGRNGAGKSTTMKSVIGITPPKGGAIRFRGTQISGRQPFQIARLGVGFVPDDRRVFADLTVDENLEISERGEGRWDRRTIYELFPVLGKYRARRAGFLSGGEQQMLAIGRALVTNPEFLLLDEPTEGLAPMIVQVLEETICELKRSGLTILLSEQNQQVALGLADRAYLIDNGMIRFAGTIDELRDNEAVLKKYLSV